jgi:hypothetical protein
MSHYSIPSTLNRAWPLHESRACASGTESNFDGFRLASTFKCRAVLVAVGLIQTAYA